jgi:hypothetical protein
VATEQETAEGKKMEAKNLSREKEVEGEWYKALQLDHSGLINTPASVG